MKNSISRNDLCHCGSGLKYKKCCMLKNNSNFNSNKIPRTKEYIKGMVLSARLAKKTLIHTAKHLKAGVTTKELEKIANDFFIKNGARSATLNYQGYTGAICTSINEVICHGIPSDRVILDTDIINLDISCILNGYYGDVSETYALPNASSQAKNLIKVTSECLDLAIAATKPFGRIGDIGAAIEHHAKKFGYSVVEKFVGHGIGTRFHEEPQVPHFGQAGRGERILPGMLFTIEPMINEGVLDAVFLSDGWTAITKDGKNSAQFEHTLLITDSGVRVITNEDESEPLIPQDQLSLYN